MEDVSVCVRAAVHASRVILAEHGVEERGGGEGEPMVGRTEHCPMRAGRQTHLQVEGRDGKHRPGWR